MRITATRFHSKTTRRMHHSRIWRLKRNFIGNLRKNYPSLVGTGTVCNLKCLPLKGYITVCFFLAALWNCESRAWTWQILQRKNRCIFQGFLYLFRWSRGSTHKMPAPPPWYPKYRYQIYRPSPVYCCILSAFCATKVQVFWKNVHTDVIRFGQLPSWTDLSRRTSFVSVSSSTMSSICVAPTPELIPWNWSWFRIIPRIRWLLTGIRQND